MSALRSVAFTALLDWPDFAAMESRRGSIVTTDFMVKIGEAQAAGDTRSLYALMQEYQSDITANGTCEPGALERYCDCLVAGREREAAQAARQAAV